MNSFQTWLEAMAYSLGRVEAEVRAIILERVVYTYQWLHI
jgi:hypothetical protein